MKIAYEATYATRGKTGIPRDAKSLITIFSSIQGSSLDVIFFIKDAFIGLGNQRRVNQKRPQIIGSAFRLEGSSRTVIPARIRSLVLASEAFRPKNKVRLINLTDEERTGALGSLEIYRDSVESANFYVGALNFKSRLLRPKWFARFKISKLDADIFVQQQADPLKISSKTAHVLRLHDILPITHPQYFDDLSVQVFSKSLNKMIKNKPFIVMDSQSCADELGSLFNLKGKIFVVPPVIEFPSEPVAMKKKQIIIVNTLEPRKRTQSAIDGFLYAKHAKYLDSDWKLIVVGGSGWLQEKLFDNLKNNKLGELVEYFDSPTDATLAQLYDESSIVLSLSAAEGFGLPPLEGMYYGCLPIVSGINTHRENLGNYAIYVKDVDAVSVANALKEGVEAISSGGIALENQIKNYVRSTFGKDVISRKWESVLNTILDLHRNAKG